jgi:hypothetical protein
MPVSRVLRYASLSASDAGQQTVIGALTFLSPSVVKLDPAVYTRANTTYALFTYTTDCTGFDQLSVDDSLLTTLMVQSGSLTHDTGSKRITVTLVAR